MKWIIKDMKLYKLIIISLIFTITITSNVSFASKTPYLVVKILEGNQFDLNNYKDKVVIVAFWTSWCSICRVEMVKLEKLYQKYSREKLEIIAINIDDMEESDQDIYRAVKKFSYKIAKFSKAEKISFQKPNSVPTIYIINQNTTIIDPDSIEDVVDEMIKSSNQVL